MYKSLVASIENKINIFLTYTSPKVGSSLSQNHSYLNTFDHISDHFVDTIIITC